MSLLGTASVPWKAQHSLSGDPDEQQLQQQHQQQRQTQ